MIFQQSDSFHIHDSATKKCVNVYVNGNFEDGRKLYVEPEWSMRDFLQACSHRLETGTVASRVFNSDGTELDDPMLLDDNGMVFVSEGEPFIMPSMRFSESDAREEPSKDENMPSLVGGYQVGSLLGKGGFGEVRVGTHQLTGERVALKFLKKSEIMSMGAAERTVTEIQCLMAMKHNNIIRLYQHVESMHHYVLIFDLMEGGDLWGYQRNLAEGRGVMEASTGLPAMALTEEEARSVFHQIVAGIAYAHNQHICHRDLKLENILLKNKNLEVVKIADFGLSAFYRPGTNIQTNCGTLSFLAPEVFKGTSNAGPPLDVWALGVILFSMLCGRLPFEGTDLSYERRPKTAIIRARILKCQYKIDESLSPEVKDLVRRMLRLDPAERATVPEIANHFWLRGAGSAPEIKRERSSSNIFGGTVFSASGKEREMSRESSEQSACSKSPTPRSPALDSKRPSASDLSMIRDALDTEQRSPRAEDSLDHAMSPSNPSPLSADLPKTFKLVPLRRNTGLNVDAHENADLSRSETTRRARAMLSDESDSLTEAVSNSSSRFTRAKSQPSTSSGIDLSGVSSLKSGLSKDDTRRPSLQYKVDELAPPIHQGSPKGSARGQSPFFTAGSASLNTHIGSAAAAKRSTLYDQTSSSNGRSPSRDYK